jgi:hypothetical protein
VNLDLRIIEDVFGGCLIVGPRCDRDKPGQRSLLAPLTPFGAGRYTRKEAERVLQRMQQLEAMSLLA